MSDPRSRRGRTIAYHLAPAARWESTPVGAPFHADSLASEGFIHLTHRTDDLVAIANAFYRDESGPHVVLTVVLARLDAPWRYDGDRRFPHVYGPLDGASIVEVRSMERDASGAFVGPGRRWSEHPWQAPPATSTAGRTGQEG